MSRSTAPAPLTWPDLLEMVRHQTRAVVRERAVKRERIRALAAPAFPPPNMTYYVLDRDKPDTYHTRKIVPAQLDDPNRPWVGQWFDIKPFVARRPPPDAELPADLLRKIHEPRRGGDRFYERFRQIRREALESFRAVSGKWLSAESPLEEDGENTSAYYPPLWFLDDYVAALDKMFDFLDGSGAPDARPRALQAGLYPEGGAAADADWRANADIYRYIVGFWGRSLRYRPYECRTGKGVSEPLPGPFMVPNGVINETTGEIEGWFDEMYRWDTYFQNLGLEICGGKTLVKQHYLNLASMYYRRGRVPNASLVEFQSHSQPPLEAAGVMRLIRQGTRPGEWSDLVVDGMARELILEWFNPFLTGNHRINEELFERFGLVSKHGTLHFNHELVGSESGFDHDFINSRYGEDMLPFPLLATLHLQADEIAAYYRLRRNAKADLYAAITDQLRAVLQQFWVTETPFAGFRDIELYRDNGGKIAGKPILYRRLATDCTALWAGVATRDQARQLLQNLTCYEGSNGLAATCPADVAANVERGKLSENRLERLQWEMPNMWLPQIYQTVWGCLRYADADPAFGEYAVRVAGKVVRHLEEVFHNGHMQGFKEKYAYDAGVEINPGFYGQETGFGWTIGVYLWLKRFLVLTERNSPQATAQALGVPFIHD